MPRERFDISLEDLQTFIVVADHGSFSRAAERLNLSQPSVSNRVKQIEQRLGIRLLDRTTRRVELTPRGRRLHERASTTLRGLHDLLREFAAETGGDVRQIDVAATMMIASVALAPIVASFSEVHPGITVRLKDRIPAEAMAAVADGTCDLAVMVMEQSHPALDFEPLLADRCVAVTPLDHPLLGRGPAALAEVLAYPLLSPDGHVSLRRAVEAAAASRGLSPVFSPQARGVTNVMTLLAMAAAGLGICIHPSTLVPPEFRPAIGLVEIADYDIVRTIGIVTAIDRDLPAAAAKFRDYLRVAIREFGGQSSRELSPADRARYPRHNRMFMSVRQPPLADVRSCSSPS